MAKLKADYLKLKSDVHKVIKLLDAEEDAFVAYIHERDPELKKVANTIYQIRFDRTNKEAKKHDR